MDLDTFTWLAVGLVLGLAALAVTAHVLATDQGLAHIRGMLRGIRNKHTTERSSERSAPTLEGHHHAHDGD